MVAKLESTPRSERKRAQEASLLKESRRTRVELCGAERTVRKTYRVPPHLRWRTFGLRSRAQREFEGLNRLRKAGIPAVRPLDWSESRSLGFVTSCTLETEFIEAEPLEEWLRVDHPQELKHRVMTRCGDLLRRIHEAGLLCHSFHLRNVLVDPDLELHMIDQPRLLAYPRSIIRTRRALVDLWDAVYSKGRGYLSSAEVRALVLSYCAGDRELCDAIDRRVGAWSRQRQRLEKNWTALLEHIRRH